ncbi:phosphate signaling complex protein PhoU [Mycobacterium sp. NPDC050853]|uniref:phosphate signaling complex protein PhoU n=1 Tax=Mycobacterium sp. NPDC050853 TaxID=3155160 RepID=UPI0033DAABBD
MRTVFHEQLAALNAGIADACGLAGQAMECATEALLHADLLLAEKVFTLHDRIVSVASHSEVDAFVLLARQAPVAGDLRAVVAALKNVADVDRMASLALHVAKTARRRHPSCALPEDVRPVFSEMGGIAVAIGNNTKTVLISGDPDKAEQLSRDDEAMNHLHQNLFTALSDPQWTHGTAAAVDVTLLGRYYERFADHAVEIGHRVIYQATGTTTASRPTS